jgi:hypothetical protein
MLNNKAHKNMKTYIKTIELNGKLTKVKVGFLYHETERIVSSYDWKMPVSIFIDDFCYEKVVNVSRDTSKKFGGLKFTCNKTGVQFNDNEKKVIEHILKIN